MQPKQRGYGISLCRSRRAFSPFPVTWVAGMGVRVASCDCQREKKLAGDCSCASCLNRSLRTAILQEKSASLQPGRFGHRQSPHARWGLPGMPRAVEKTMSVDKCHSSPFAVRATNAPSAVQSELFSPTDPLSTSMEFSPKYKALKIRTRVVKVARSLEQADGSPLGGSPDCGSRYATDGTDHEEADVSIGGTEMGSDNSPKENSTTQLHPEGDCQPEESPNSRLLRFLLGGMGALDDGGACWPDEKGHGAARAPQSRCSSEGSPPLSPLSGSSSGKASPLWERRHYAQPRALQIPI